MNNFEKLNAEFFDESCEKFKNSSWQACCYLDEFMQEVYYHSIFKNINKNFKNILDIGCGQGDLLGFLKKNSNNIDYTGLDVSSKMIDCCKKRFPKQSFNNSSFLDFKSENSFDVVLAVGVFNLKVCEKPENQIEYLKQNIQKMYSICNKCCSFTLMSKHGNQNSEDGLFYYNPWNILEYCLDLTSSVILDHSSIPIDFIVTLYKD